jgi:tungstate transport system permease protein
LSELWEAFKTAIHLLVTLDPEVVQIAWRSLWIAAASCAVCIVICIPLGNLIHFNRFRGKDLLISIIQTLYSMPTVAVGLIIVMLVRRSGPFGSFGLLFDPKGMVVGQILLVTPVMLGLVISALSGLDKSMMETATSLGASRMQAYRICTREARFAVMTAVVIGFGRAISEVGLSVMVGGNIEGYTRTLTTAIPLETSRGNFSLALALGIVLVFIAFLINIALYMLQHRKIWTKLFIWPQS